MLRVEGINVFYGAIHALKNVSFEVGEGEVVSLIGANGAGKTTIMHTLSGLLKASGGKIWLQDTEITTVPAEKIVGMGLVQVPEGRRIFGRMSVLENLMMGAYLRRDKKEIAEDIEKMYLRFPRLKERSKQPAGTMSGGEQQMLAIARALMGRPRLLLMDEPSMGLAPILVNEIFHIIKDINQQGMTVLLVEQNANKALSIADRAYVLETGSIVMTGSGQELLHDDRVRQAYLGLGEL